MPEGCTILRLSIDLVLVPDSAHFAPSLEAVTADEPVARALGVEVGSPIFLIERTSYGTALASAIIAAGFCVSLFCPHGALLHSVTGTHVMKAGVALLVLLPITRIALMLVIFLSERDFAYAAISALVPGIIGAGYLVAL